MNCKHRKGYEVDWKNMKPCSLCEKEVESERKLKKRISDKG